MPVQYTREKMTIYVRERRNKLKLPIYVHDDKYYLLKHNKIHRMLMRSLLRKTYFLSWLIKYDEVMTEFLRLYPSYQNNKKPVVFKLTFCRLQIFRNRK